MSTATAQNNLTGIGVPGQFARMLTEGPLELNGLTGLRVTAPVIYKTTITAMTVTATITTAAIFGGQITSNPATAGAVTYTMPTGAVFSAAWLVQFGQAAVVGDTVEFVITSTSTVAAEDITVAGASGMTAVGNMTVASNAAVTDQSFGTFRVVNTGTDAWSIIRG